MDPEEEVAPAEVDAEAPEADEFLGQFDEDIQAELQQRLSAAETAAEARAEARAQAAYEARLEALAKERPGRPEPAPVAAAAPVPEPVAAPTAKQRRLVDPYLSKEEFTDQFDAAVNDAVMAAMAKFETERVAPLQKQNEELAGYVARSQATAEVQVASDYVAKHGLAGLADTAEFQGSYQKWLDTIPLATRTPATLRGVASLAMAEAEEALGDERVTEIRNASVSTATTNPVPAPRPRSQGNPARSVLPQVGTPRGQAGPDEGGAVRPDELAKFKSNPHGQVGDIPAETAEAFRLAMGANTRSVDGSYVYDRTNATALSQHFQTQQQKVAAQQARLRGN